MPMDDTGAKLKFKDYYGVELAHDLARRIAAVYPGFDGAAFVGYVAARVDTLELKGRVAVLAAGLREYLPAAYSEALDILCGLLGPEHTPEQGMFTHGYHLMPVAYFVEVYGLDDFAASLAALNAITRRHTAEFAIRPFLVRYPEQTLGVLREWVHDSSPHVRRLVSEGTRPRLPWATRLTAFIADPSPVLALLEHLKADPSPYVQKSVANNLNDIQKDHPALVLATLTRWQTDASEATRWIIRHALRNLVKQGNAAALRLLAFDAPQVSIQDFTVTPSVAAMGDTLTIAFALRNEMAATQQLVVDYRIHFVKAHGKTQPRVFKLRMLALRGGETVQVQKKHLLKPVSTRRYYPGEHQVELQVNGMVVAGATFVLQQEPPAGSLPVGD